VNLPIAMSRFAQKQVKDYYGLDTGYIPHGIDPNHFVRYSDEKREELKRQMGLNGKFVIGAVFRNQPRKFSDRLFKIMYLIKDQIPNAVLFCHCDPYDPASYFDMIRYIQFYKLQNRVVFSGMSWHTSFDYKRMPDVYNVMDIKLDVTSGEGFGITIIESASCEVPQLVTDYTTTQELIKDHKCGEGIKLSGCEESDMFNDMTKYDDKMMNGTILGSWHVERGVCDIRDAADKIVKFYKDEALRKEYGKNGRKAVEKFYDFKFVGQAWEDAIKRVVNG